MFIFNLYFLIMANRHNFVRRIIIGFFFKYINMRLIGPQFGIKLRFLICSVHTDTYNNALIETSNN